MKLDSCRVGCEHEEVLADLNRISSDKGYQAMSSATLAAFYCRNSQLYCSLHKHWTDAPGYFKLLHLVLNE